MKTSQPIKRTYRGRPAIVSEWRQSGPTGLRVVQTHWQDTDTFRVKVITGDGRRPGATVHELVDEDRATDATAATLVAKYLGQA